MRYLAAALLLVAISARVTRWVESEPQRLPEPRLCAQCKIRTVEPS